MDLTRCVCVFVAMCLLRTGSRAPYSTAPEKQPSRVTTRRRKERIGKRRVEHKACAHVYKQSCVYIETTGKRKVGKKNPKR